jgi:hydrogenase/urease accessory protein HupE
MLENISMKSSVCAYATRLHARFAGLAVATLPSLALAHPGDHGSDWLHAVMHLLSEPDHLAAAALAVGVAVVAVRAITRRNRRDASKRDS